MNINFDLNLHKPFGSNIISRFILNSGFKIESNSFVASFVLTFVVTYGLNFKKFKYMKSRL